METHEERTRREQVWQFATRQVGSHRPARRSRPSERPAHGASPHRPLVPRSGHRSSRTRRSSLFCAGQRPVGARRVRLARQFDWRARAWARWSRRSGLAPCLGGCPGSDAVPNSVVCLRERVSWGRFRHRWIGRQCQRSRHRRGPALMFGVARPRCDTRSLDAPGDDRPSWRRARVTVRVVTLVAPVAGTTRSPHRELNHTPSCPHVGPSPPTRSQD
jgi:hypothetical protein